MSHPGKDIRAGEKTFSLVARSSAYDMAHHFRERTVMEVRGDLSELAGISIGIEKGLKTGGQFVSLLTEASHLDAEFYIAPFKDDVLIDVHVELADRVAERLAALAGVTEVERAAGERWRIFGELPDQSAAETPYDTIRFMDPRRRELGSRVFRSAAEPVGMDWRHARKWDGHAFRLGLLADHRCIVGQEIKPEEAGYHRLLNDGAFPEVSNISRRILPVRIDVYGNGVPKLTGCELYGDDTCIGQMLDHEGICGIALVEIEPWRETAARGASMTCDGLPVVITWPTWLAIESEGRVGPAAGMI